MNKEVTSREIRRLFVHEMGMIWQLTRLNYCPFYFVIYIRMGRAAEERTPLLLP